MATIIPHTTRATGTVLTAAIYNTDHQVHVTNATSLNDELAGVANVGNQTGFVVGNGAGQVFGRSLEAGTGITITNANGITDNPNIGLSGNVDITAATIHSTVNTSNLELAGGNGSGVGAHILVFGGAHATNANNAFHDAALHTMRTQAGGFLSGGTPLLTVNGTVLSQESAGGTGRFIGGNFAVLGCNTSGTVDLRPGGAAVTTGRLSMTTTLVTIDNALTVTGAATFSSTVATSGSILATNGSAANPSYGFSGDAGNNTGMFRSSENTIGFTTGGTVAMSINTDVTMFGRADADRFISNSGVFSQDVAVPGSIFLRPNGPDSTAGQMTLDTGGLLTVIGGALIERSAVTPLIVNRQTDDGGLLLWQRAGVTVGTISVAAGVVTYGTFTGSHTSQWQEGKEQDNVLRGTVIETVDQLCSWEQPVEYRYNEILPRCKVSDTVGAETIYGVFSNYDLDDENGDVIIASLGTFVIRMQRGSKVRKGALVESAGDGCAKPQSDGVMRSSTIAKITSNTIIEEYGDGSFLVACTLHCG